MIRSIAWESWALSAEADRRFKMIFALVGFPMFAMGLWIGLLQFESAQTRQGAIEGRRVVELTVAQAQIVQTPDPPASVAEAADDGPPKPVPPPTAPLPPQPKQVFARLEGKQTEDAPSILVLKRGQFDSGNQHPNLITSHQPLVAVSNPARNPAAPPTPGPTGAPAQSREGAAPTAQEAAPKPPPPDDQPRDIQEVQQVFGRNGASLNAIYVHRAGGDLNMADGKVVIKFTVAPNGTVTDCSLVSSTFHDPVFENRIVAQIRLFRFPAKQVPAYNSPHYTIEFRGA